MKLWKAWGSLLILAVGAGCVSSKGLTAEEKEKLKANILETEPQDVGTKLDINFENKFRLLGSKVEPPEARPGTEVKLTYYWKCDDTIEDGWMLFTHVRDPVLDKRDNLDNVGPLRENKDPGAANPKQILPPSKWEKGKVYVDEQTYKVPDWVKAGELEVLTGIWKGNARLRILTGANDGDNAAIAAKIKTGIKPPEQPKHTEVPSITVFKLAKDDKITIDGKSDDKAWGGAPVLGPFVDVGTGEPNTTFPVNASAKMAWDDANLYVMVDVRDTDLIGGFDDKTKKDADKASWTVKGQPMLWTRETVELMVDPDGDGDNDDYYELQINTQNKVFHSQFDHYKDPSTDPQGPFGHEEWDPKLKSAVVVKGTLDKQGDNDEGYVVEAAIPWAAFAKAKNHPPKEGDMWRMNLYAMKKNNGVAWSAILGEGSFHKASRFGRVSFAAMAPPMPVPPVGSNDPATGAIIGGRRFPPGGPMRGFPPGVVGSAPPPP